MYNVSDKIFEMVQTDRSLRLKIALNLGVVEQSVLNAVDRRSDNLTKYGAIKAIKEHTGLNESDILVEEVENNNVG